MKSARSMSVLITIIILLSVMPVSSVFAISNNDSSESTTSGETSLGDAIISADGKSASIIVPSAVKIASSSAVSSLTYKEKTQNVNNYNGDAIGTVTLKYYQDTYGGRPIFAASPQPTATVLSTSYYTLGIDHAMANTDVIYVTVEWTQGMLYGQSTVTFYP